MLTEVHILLLTELLMVFFTVFDCFFHFWL